VSAIVAIPARLQSTRFPRKVLADLNGDPMLWHVCQRAATAQNISAVWVLTDSEEVYEAAVSWGVKALMTSEDCTSGTDRIASVIDKLDADIVVNVQADEPLITGELIDGLVEALEGSEADVATLVFPISELEDLKSVTLNKVVRANNGEALYFSHTPIPYVRDLPMDQWLDHYTFWGHVGVYAYKRDVLVGYYKLPGSHLESAEKLEQLRLMSAGKRILTVETCERLYGVDVPEELEVVKKLLLGQAATAKKGTS
jgi:3-deoxy-manno-octulosonate cytidylyltransferase (CMP-KDO synthetase)